MKGILLSSLSLVMATSSVVKTELCQFAPANDLYISADQKAGEATGISEAQFNGILDRIQKLYGPIVQAKGGTLEIRRLWTDGTVNASAERVGTTYRLNMYGGMARHQLMTPDGFALVVCHEMGHHLGGKPKYKSFFGSETWASVEGQSDYFGTSKCMRRMYLDMTAEELADFTRNNAYAEKKCAETFTDEKEITMCLRNSEAGVVLGDVLGELGGTGATNLETPSTDVYNGINQQHPKAQCRADTYFQGSLCSVPFNVDFSDANQLTGACVAESGFTVGLRPKCWFNPKKRKLSLDKGLSKILDVNNPNQQKVYY